MNDILSSNRIVFKGKTHYYEIDLSKRNFNLDFVSPYQLKIHNRVIEEGTWTRMIIRLLNYLINNFNIPQDKLLNYEVSWSKAPMFTSNKLLESYHQLNNGLFINCNRTSTHLCWCISEIITIFNLRSTEISLLVFKNPKNEDSQVRDYLYEVNKEKISRYLKRELDYDSSKILMIFDGLSKIDMLMLKKFDIWVSIILIEDSMKYANFKSKFKNYIVESNLDIKVKNVIINLLNLLTNYHTYQDKKELLSDLGN